MTKRARSDDNPLELAADAYEGGSVTQAPETPEVLTSELEKEHNAGYGSSLDSEVSESGTGAPAQAFQGEASVADAFWALLIQAGYTL